MAKVLFQGHGSLRLTLDNGKVIYIDPFAGEGYDKPADLILVTHQHYDHTEINKPPHAKDCVIYQNTDALKNGVYNTLDIYGAHIEAVQAYNKNHPKNECVGYLIKADEKLLYFAGDTSETEQMKELADRHIDYAFLPADGIYNMDVPEAVKCAEIIKAKHTIPVHIAPGKLFDTERAKLFSASSAMIILPGDEIDII